MYGRLPKCMFSYLICSNSSCDPPPLWRILPLPGLGPSILYFHPSPLWLVICFIHDWQVFIKIHDFQTCYHGIICLASLHFLSFVQAQVYVRSLAPIIFVDTGPSVLWIRTKIIVKSSTINPIWTITWRPQFALYFQTNKHSNKYWAIWYIKKFKSTCNLMNRLTCPL